MTSPAGPRRALDRLRDLVRWRRTTPYKSPQEIALENAAESLGATLADYYPDDRELDDLGSESALDPRGEAARQELLAYVASIRARRRRARRARLVWVVAGCLAFAVAGAGVTFVALDGNQGYGADKLGDRTSRDAGRPLVPTPVYNENAPRLGTRVTASLPFGSAKLVSTTYLNVVGDLCSDLTEVRGEIAEQNGGGGCPSVRHVLGDLRTKPAMPYGIASRQGAVTLQGFARPDVVRISGHSHWGPVTVALTRTWKPRVMSGERPFAVKAFLVVAAFGARGRTIRTDLADRLSNDGSYNLRATLRDGRVMDVGRMSGRDADLKQRMLDPIPPGSVKAGG